MNDPQDPQARSLVASVVAWHNRHLLARRITPAAVQGIGVVALPFAAADQIAGKAGLRRLFKERFIAGMSPRRVAQWALRHGQYDSPLAPGAPQRDVPVDPPRQVDVPAGSVAMRFVTTAAIEAGGRRTRVLLGAAPAGRPAAVLGARLHSPGRCAAALALCVGVVLLAYLLLKHAPNAGATPEPVAVAQQGTVAFEAASMLAIDGESGPTPHADLRRVPAVITPSVTASATDTFNHTFSDTASGQGTDTSTDARADARADTSTDTSTDTSADTSTSATAAHSMSLDPSSSAISVPPAAHAERARADRPASAPSVPPREAHGPPAARAMAEVAPAALPAQPGPSMLAPPSAALSRAVPAPQFSASRAGQPIRPWLSESQKRAARDESARMRAALARSEVGRPVTPAPRRTLAIESATDVPAPAAPAPRPAVLPSFALVTPVTPRRANAEAALKKLDALARQMPTTPDMRVELMKVPQAWRAVWWPFAARADAERARRRLQMRGVPAEVLEF